MVEAAGGMVDQVVSDEQEDLILVDERDREIGSLSKAACHDGDGVLHRAFSLFIFNRQAELLLQRRSAAKRLWPGHWSNSCCSHPRSGETMEEAIHRRLIEELGMRGDLHYLYKFQYQARYGEVGSERELCWVYAGISDDAVRPNGNEIGEWRWAAPEDLDNELATNSDAFTPWLGLEWHRVREAYRGALGIGQDRSGGSESEAAR